MSRSGALSSQSAGECRNNDPVTLFVIDARLVAGRRFCIVSKRRRLVNSRMALGLYTARRASYSQYYSLESPPGAPQMLPPQWCVRCSAVGRVAIVGVVLAMNGEQCGGLVEQLDYRWVVPKIGRADRKPQVDPMEPLRETRWRSIMLY